ncbi:MAG TPA: hypothetical protein VN961_10015, partial [Streptosporangiaceae bacterium]|nr:hypothetical protein [Streptosporangiaceae bacterium]
VRGRLDEAAAHLTVAETAITSTPPDRKHRLEVAIAALKLSLARKRGHLAGVVEQVRFLASPITGQSDDDIALDSDLRAVALMNLGIVEAWSLGIRTASGTCKRVPILRGGSDVRTSKWPAWLSSPSHRRSSPSQLRGGGAERR